MLSNLLKIAIRNVLDRKRTSLLNIIGLALSMSVCMVIIVIITDQTSYDNFNTKADRIYRITTINTLKLTTNYTILDDAVILNRLFLGLGMFKDININIYGLYASSSFFNVFDFGLEKGNPATALVEPFSIILKEDVARKFFGTKDPMGKTFQVEKLGYFKVTGILKKNRRQITYSI